MHSIHKDSVPLCNQANSVTLSDFFFFVERKAKCCISSQGRESQTLGHFSGIHKTGSERMGIKQNDFFPAPLRMSTLWGRRRYFFLVGVGVGRYLFMQFLCGFPSPDVVGKFTFYMGIWSFSCTIKVKRWHVYTVYSCTINSNEHKASHISLTEMETGICI